MKYILIALALFSILLFFQGNKEDSKIDIYNKCLTKNLMQDGVPNYTACKVYL